MPCADDSATCSAELSGPFPIRAVIVTVADAPSRVSAGSSSSASVGTTAGVTSAGPAPGPGPVAFRARSTIRYAVPFSSPRTVWLVVDAPLPGTAIQAPKLPGGNATFHRCS